MACNGYDMTKRRWRHLDTSQNSTFIEADVPRVECKEHGIHSVGVSWAEEKSRFTILFEWLVMWIALQSRGVSRGLARKKKEPDDRSIKLLEM